MKEFSKVDSLELKRRSSDLIERVESQPEQWYKLLIERLVTQEILVEELTKQVSLFQDIEKLNSVIIDNKLFESPAFLRNTYEVRAMHHLWLDQGFYDAEETDEGSMFRWTKQNFYFELPIKRKKEKLIRLHLLSAIKNEVLEEIECYANGTAISLSAVSSDTGIVFEGVLSEESSSAITRLSFQTKKSFTPKEINPEAEDQRLLAVAFNKLTVE